MAYQHLRLPCPVRPLLALGGELKNAVGLARDYDAWISAPVGDLQSLENLTAFEETVAEMEAELKITPEAIVCDLHPGYLSSRWGAAAAAARGLPLIKVQHHHAHIASVMADHGVTGDQPVIGLALDGTGYGTDGAIWGGEVLIANYESFQRAAQIAYAPLPGGDAAIHKPYRMALAQLWAAGIDWDDDLPPVQVCPEIERRVLQRQLERKLTPCRPAARGGCSTPYQR